MVQAKNIRCITRKRRVQILTMPLTSLARSQGNKIYHALREVEKTRADGAFLLVCYGSSSKRCGGCFHMASGEVCVCPTLLILLAVMCWRVSLLVGAGKKHISYRQLSTTFLFTSPVYEGICISFYQPDTDFM